MADKSDGDRKKTLRSLVAHIKARILLCSRDWRNKSSNLSSSVTPYEQNTRLEKICITLVRLSTFVSCKLNFLLPRMYKNKYCAEVERAAMLVLQPYLDQRLLYFSRRRSMERKQRRNYFLDQIKIAQVGTADERSIDTIAAESYYI